MKSVILSIICINFIYANTVYSISEEEYIQYEENPSLMIEKFKMKFLHPKVKKVVKKDIINEQGVKKEVITSIEIKKSDDYKVVMIKNVVNKTNSNSNKNNNLKIIEEKVIISDKNSFYNINEVKNKLKYNTLLKENIPLLLSSIEKILSKNNNSYDSDEIKLVLSQIHDKKVSPFESRIYLNQIKNLLKGVR